jgi:hypothetical protein
VVLVLGLHQPDLLAALLPEHLALRRAVGRRRRAALLPEQLAALGQDRLVGVRLRRRLGVGVRLRRRLVGVCLRRRLRLLARARVCGGGAHGEGQESQGSDSEDCLHGVNCLARLACLFFGV